jgi:large-conductance mechanosensitive channel
VLVIVFANSMHYDSAGGKCYLPCIINTLLIFVIVAFLIFWLVRGINRMRRPAPAAAPSTRACPYCATDISIKASRCPNCTSDLRAAPSR